MAVSSLLTMTGTKAAITAAHFSPDGRCALTASVDGTLLIWDVTHTTLRGAALSAWICSRMSHGVGRLTDEDISDVLFKDVLPTDRDGDLAAAVLARWPHLGDIDVPKPLPSRLDTLLDAKPNQSLQSQDRDDPPADGSLAEPAQAALTSITPGAIAKGPSRRAMALIALTCLGAILAGWFLLGRA